MFIRVKRKKSTYFVNCDPSETVLEIKAKLQTLTDIHISTQRLILVSSRRILDDARTLADQKVENDAIVALALRKGTGEWADIDIEKPANYRSMLD